MEGIIKKHWSTLLGALFIFLSCTYLFKYAVDLGWISDQLKIGVGIAVAAGFVLIGVTMQKRNYNLGSEIITGLGSALFYTTFSFAGIYFALWTPMTVFLSMLAVSLATLVYSYKLNFRLLMNIALLGGIVAPLVMKPHGDQVFTLFLYLLVINAIYFTVSVYKKWTELRLVTFLATWILFTVYYFYYSPESYIKPFLYSLSAFIFYVISLIVSSLKDNTQFEGLNLYLGILNGAIFTIWSMKILDGIVPYSMVFLGMGLLYIAAALVVYSVIKDFSAPVIIKFFSGILFILIAGSEFGNGLVIKPMISVYMWALAAIILIVVGQINKSKALKLLSAAIWVITVLYWFSTTWQVPVGEWFGTFIPILNWSGLAWVVLAAMGFYFATKVDFSSGKAEKWATEATSTFFATGSHLIVGGLLTFQIDNLWEVYTIKTFDLWLTLSLTWGIYALLITLWSAYTKQIFFKWFGSAVLGVVALKTIFIDLSGADMIYKILVFFVLGLISFAISYINNFGMSETEKKDTEKVIF